jgi:hypothetical protein
MKKRSFRTFVTTLSMLSLVWLTGVPCFAGEGSHQAKPEFTAKREMVRKQQEQRITPSKRKAAAEALKAERLRVYKAKQAMKNASPGATTTNQPTTQP